MDPHLATWFSYLPGYQDLAGYLGAPNRMLMGVAGPMVAQHIYGAVLVIAFLGLGALSSRKTFAQGPVPARRFGLSAVFDAIMGVAAGLCKDVIGGKEWKRTFH